MSTTLEAYWNPLLKPDILTEIARSQFYEVNPALIYLKRLPVVKAEEIEIVGFGPVPNIKNGTFVGESIQKRLARGLDVDRELILDWRNRVIDRVIQGIHQRMNILACEAALNAPLDLQDSVMFPWGHSQSTPISDVRKFVRDAKKRFEVIYDRMTLAKASLELAFSTPEFSRARDAYGELFDVEIEHSFSQDLGIFAQLVKIVVEVDDSTYREINAKGEKVTHRILPKGKVIFSSSTYDNNKGVADFAVTLVTDPNFSQTAFDSPLSYAALQTEEDDTENLVVWAAAKGNVRRHEFTYTGVLQVDEPTK